MPVVLVGLAFAPTGPRPDILIGREGALLAVREPTTGLLAAHAERSSRFEIRRWLEHDGDARDPAEAVRGRAFRCDATGCVTQAPGALVALSRHPAGAAEDCARVAILVVAGPAPQTCTGPRLVYDRSTLRESGTVALYRTDDGGWRAESVAGARGVRPWSLARLPPAASDLPRDASRALRASRLMAPPNANSVGRYAAPRAAANAFPISDEPRPDIEDDP